MESGARYGALMSLVGEKSVLALESFFQSTYAAAAYDGVPDYLLRDDEFVNMLRDDFNRYREGVLEPGEPNALIVVKSSKEAYSPYDISPDEMYSEIEGFCWKNGVNLLILEDNQNIFSEFKKYEQSEIKAREVVGLPFDLSEGMYGAVDERLKESSIVGYVIGRDFGGLCSLTLGSTEAVGMARSDRFLLSTHYMDNYSSIKKSFTHDGLLHPVGLPHVDDRENFMSVGEGGFQLEEEQWEWIREQLS